MDNQLEQGPVNEQETPETVTEKSENNQSMASFEDYEKSFQTIRRNDYLIGKVVKIENDGVYVDIGWKREGFIPLDQLSHKPVASPEEEVKVGEDIPVIVIKVDDMEGELILSKKRADLETAWRRVVNAYEKGEVLTATVVEAVKGGLLVDLGLRGFVPASQVDTRPVKDLEDFVGDALRLRVIELDPSRRKVVLSRKKVLEEERIRMKETTLDNLYEGKIVKGTVARLTNFGAFINLGGVDGLVHISEMAWKRIKHPSEVLKVGQPVDVMVLKVDPKKERISLSVRQAQPDPWSTIAETMSVGTVVKGTITKIAKKYVFIEVAPGVEGVIPMHELSEDRMVKPEEVVKEGTEVDVKVLEVKPEARRMVLSLRQAHGESTRKDVSQYLAKPSSVGAGGGATIGDILRAKAQEREEERVAEEKAEEEVTEEAPPEAMAPPEEVPVAPPTPEPEAPAPPEEPVVAEAPETPETPEAPEAPEAQEIPEAPASPMATAPSEAPVRPPIPGLAPAPFRPAMPPASPRLTPRSPFEEKVPEIKKIPIENLDTGTEVDNSDTVEEENNDLFVEEIDENETNP